MWEDSRTSGNTSGMGLVGRSRTINTPIRKEANILFNIALNTFYFMLYGVRHMVKNHTDSEKKHAATTWAAHSN